MLPDASVALAVNNVVEHALMLWRYHFKHEQHKRRV